MPRRPSPNPPGPGDQIRISFLLDRRREPELAYIFDMEGHGDRPRELLRLAQIGYRAEVEMREFHAAARAAQLASLSNAAVVEPSVPSRPISVAAPEPTEAAPALPPATAVEANKDASAARSAPKAARARQEETPNPQPEAPAVQSEEEPIEDLPAPKKISGLGGFLA